RLGEAGFAEVVVTGIHVGLYGRDLAGQPSLAQVLLAVAEAPGVERVRLSSVEASEVDEELLEAMCHPGVCPHLHIPLQSGDPAVLRRMNRRYTPGKFLRAVELARSRLNRPAVTTDVMVGFPGETDEQFRNTAALCRAARFSRIHVFPFSPRPGTAAAGMSGHLPPDVVRERSRRLRELGRALAAEWAESFVGSHVRVLFERCTRAGSLVGYTDRYVRLQAAACPESVEGATSDLVGRVARVHCTGTDAA
ncbi:unnamed protein product, partial [marine sediment metagenome]